MKENNNTEIEIFCKFLKKRGFSFTRQRKMILEQVFKNHKHFEAKNIGEALLKRKLQVSRATVYRTLAHLENCGLIKKMDLRHGHSHFEHTHGHKHHEHICCEKCGKVIEFSDLHIEKKIAEILKKYDFNITNHSIQIFSICKNCIQ